MLHPIFSTRGLPELLVLLLTCLVQGGCASLFIKRGQPRQRIVRIVSGSIGFLLGTHLLLYLSLRGTLATLATWVRGVALVWAVLSLIWLAGYGITAFLPAPGHSRSRRGFLRTARAALFGIPTVAAGYGIFVERFKMNLREQKIELPGLPPALDGLRLVQLTDVHLSAFVSERELQRAIDMANETKAHIALITGDLITDMGDPLDLCIDRLATLRADLGIYGCLGNHERYAEAEDYTTQRAGRRGLQFLRSQNLKLTWNGASINLAGVDYQRTNRPYLTGAEALVDPVAFNVLLSHNPDVFPVAREKGFPLTLSGHTHGGQVRAEILQQELNFARFFTPYVDGLYRQGNSAIFVSRGIGTIGLPARFGAPPEVALITLCRTSS